MVAGGALLVQVHAADAPRGGGGPEAGGNRGGDQKAGAGILKSDPGESIASDECFMAGCSNCIIPYLNVVSIN